MRGRLNFVAVAAKIKWECFSIASYLQETKKGEHREAEQAKQQRTHISLHNARQLWQWLALESSEEARIT